jgi:hypothetical protein
MLLSLLTLASTVSLAFSDVSSRSSAPQPRALITQNHSFVDPSTGKVVLLQGSNVVMKGPPWLPAVTGDDVCSDRWFTNQTCRTFNKADAIHMKTMGWNFIRLGVVWAGGQPTADPVLDPVWLKRLQDILDLCHEYSIYVVLDAHQDAVGTATCGEGVPQWFSKLATPRHIGKPLQPLPDAAAAQDDWLGKNLSNWDGLCWVNDTGANSTWLLHAGEVDYNTRNPCCLRYNQGGSAWGRLIVTVQAQETISYLFLTKAGRAHYATYMGLLAAAVKDYPAAIGIELMNEPPDLQREAMYQTWQACYNAIRLAIPDIAVSVQDTGEVPSSIGDLGLSAETLAWLKTGGTHLFYAFHYYGSGGAVPVGHAMGVVKNWNMPALMTEFGSCGVKVQARARAHSAARRACRCCCGVVCLPGCIVSCLPLM